MADDPDHLNNGGRIQNNFRDHEQGIHMVVCLGRATACSSWSSVMDVSEETSGLLADHMGDVLLSGVRASLA